MKLLYITNSKIPSDKANGIQVVKMAQSFGKILGNNFNLVIPNRIQPKEMLGVSVSHHYGLPEDLPLIRLPVLDLMSLSPNYLTYWLTILTFGFSAFLYAIVSRAEVIYTRDFYLLPFLVLTGKKVFYEAHYFPTNRFAVYLHQKLLPLISGVVTISGQFLAFYHNSKIHPKKVFVSHDATDPSFFKHVSKDIITNKRRELGLNRKVVFGYIGNLFGLGEDKGGSVLVQAFKILIKNFPNAVLLVVGNSDLLPDKNVRLIGRVPYNQMPLWHNLIDVALIPFPDRPHFRYFMSPLKLFDYLVCGKPIVTTDLPSLREIISEKNAVFTKPSDHMSFARGMEILMRRPNMRLKMGRENAKMKFKYTWENRANEILKFIYDN